MEQKKMVRDNKWQKACIVIVVPPCKFKTFVKIRFVPKVILFLEILEFKHVIALCYGRK
jgi:hypothetical protein